MSDSMGTVPLRQGDKGEAVHGATTLPVGGEDLEVVLHYRCGRGRHCTVSRRGCNCSAASPTPPPPASSALNATCPTSRHN